MKHIAIDFGAGSGRVIVGNLHKGEVTLQEVHRFPNRQVLAGGRLYWDFLALFEEMKTGLRKTFRQFDDIASIGIDTWGVDFGLIDKRGRLLGNPVCYRDNRTAGILGKVFQSIPREKLYAVTGTQLMEINTAFQLYSMVLDQDPALEVADKLLFMPDLFNYFLTGRAVNEYTIASTSQLYNPNTKEWEDKVFQSLGIPRKLMQEIVFPGTVIGELSAGIVAEIGGKGVKVIAVGSHDTASAFASIERTSSNQAFISSGTWSLMGIPARQPILTPEAMQNDFTNEGAADGHIQFLRNITGLWLLQNLMKEWEEEGRKRSYDELLDEATKSTWTTTIDVDAPCFNHPENMGDAIRQYCKEKGLPVPVTQAEFARCVVLSLANKYAEVKTALETCSRQHIDTIHIVGGGAQNRLLNRLTEELTGAKVVCGAVEATAIGNIKVQAVSMNQLKH